MTMTFTVALACARCKATLTFNDERPDWKTFDYRVEMADECEKSARFVVEHADDPLPMLGERWTAHDEAGRPKFIAVNGFRIYGVHDSPYSYDWEGRPERGLALAIPEPYRYVDCPVCDAQVREPKAAR